MENTELMEEEVIEEVIPASFTSGGGLKKAASYGIAAVAGALFLEFCIKPIWGKLKGRFTGGKGEPEDSEDYYDEVQE